MYIILIVLMFKRKYLNSQKEHLEIHLSRMKA